MAFTKNDEAVSPVIGVILMVAITVILAAVIAAFVFGMAGNVQKTKVISTTVQRTSDGVMVKFMGGADQASLTYGLVTVNGVAAADYENGSGLGAPSNVFNNTLGSYVFAGGAPNGARVLVIGKFTDGSDQILQDTTV